MIFFVASYSLAHSAVDAMASHVTRTDWLCDGTKKGKNLVYQHETIVYEVPFPRFSKVVSLLS